MEKFPWSCVVLLESRNLIEREGVFSIAVVGEYGPEERATLYSQQLIILFFVFLL